jgi:hypothetical protein
MRPNALTLAVLAVIAAPLGGCAWMSSAPPSPTATAAPNSLDTDIFTTIAIVKRSGNSSRLARYALQLPTRPTQPIVRYELQFPATCGGYRFGVYESDDNEILEYRYTTETGTNVVVRDYVSGENPFISPGLWTSYDHIAGEVSAMMSDLARSSSPVVRRTYSRGLVTSLYESAQRQLGQAYQQAVHAAATCVASIDRGQSDQG